MYKDRGLANLLLMDGIMGPIGSPLILRLTFSGSLQDKIGRRVD